MIAYLAFAGIYILLSGWPEPTNSFGGDNYKRRRSGLRINETSLQ